LVHNPKFITKQNGNRLIFFLLLVKGTLFNKNRSCDSECWPSNQLLTSKNSVRIYDKHLKAWTVAYLIGTDCLLDWNREYLTAQLNHMNMTILGKLTFCDEDILCSSCFVSIDPKINFIRPLIPKSHFVKDWLLYIIIIIIIALVFEAGEQSSQLRLHGL